MSPARSQVVIVGAGPTGLMAACQLARFGVDFRIIDSKSGPTRESRALVVQARALEVYQQLGIADRAIERGYIMPAMNIHANGKRRARVPLGDIGGPLNPFPFLLVLEQSQNEELLYEHLRSLGHDVTWNCEFTGLTQSDTQVTVTFQGADGASETTEADYLIAADGASSPIRRALDIPFGGGTYNERFYVADLQIEGDIPHTEGSIFFAKEGFALALPMDGEKHFRLVGAVPKYADTETPTFDDVRRDLDPIFQRSLTFGEPNWFSSYTVHHRCVENFQSGRVFFAGDAAHIHSPAGGQGMNTGLLDAQNLAWKLALVARGSAQPSLLETYNEERLPFAQRLLQTTDRAFQAGLSRNPLLVFLRLRVFPNLIRLGMRFGGTRRLFFDTISQIGITHRGHSLAVNHGTQQDRLRAGDRFPAFEVEVQRKACSTVGLIRDPGFHVIDFAPPGRTRQNAQACAATAKDLNVPLTYKEAICLDAEWREDVEGRTYLVRPDMYVGLASTALTQEQLLDYFSSALQIEC